MTDILKYLRESKGDFVSGQELSTKLGVTRAAIWKEVESLRLLGYHIEAQTHQGYKLMGVPDRLFADELSHGLGNKIIGSKIYSFDSVDSTNDTAFRLGQENHAEGACVFAEHQNKGRGRLGRLWLAPKNKNLILSVLLRPRLTPSQSSKITLVAALSVVKAIYKATGIKAGIKWPNDVWYENKKICGILTEMSAETDRVNFLVVGIGININSKASDLPENSTSIREILGDKIDRIEFAKELLRCLEVDYNRFKGGLFEEQSREWEEYSVISGQRVVADVAGRKIYGQASGIDQDGILWIRTDEGLMEKIVAGDVSRLRAE